MKENYSQLSLAQKRAAEKKNDLMLAKVITEKKKTLINILQLWEGEKYQWEIRTINK